MTIAQLDTVFPYVCFAYGAVTTFALNTHVLGRIADEKLPGPMVETWRAHRALAMVSLVVGACWILQNIWLA